MRAKEQGLQNRGNSPRQSRLFRFLVVLLGAVALQACLQTASDREPPAARADVPEGAEEDLAAARVGDFRAQLRVAQAYFRGRRTAEAREWAEKSARQGSPQAQYYLGLMVRDGVGGARDTRQAVEWIRKSAEQGFPAAQDQLGLFYEGGYGVPQDYAEAATWYRESTLGGYVGAATNLGSLYYEGKGVPRDLQTAREWATKDDKDGHPAARQLLRLIANAEARGPVFGPRAVPPPGLTVQRGVSSIPVPRGAGYTKEFEALHNRSMADSALIAASLKTAITKLPPPYLFELARRTFDTDKQEAITWYLLGIVRSRYDALRCTDKTSHQGVLFLPRLAPRVARALKEDKLLTRKAAAAALERESGFPADSNPYWICTHGLQAIGAAMERKPLEDWWVAEERWPEIREKLRSSLRKLAEGG